jgi:tellurite resistance protein TerC
MGTFAVPPAAQSRVLTAGIVLALALRAVFIVAGAALLSAFSFLFAVFGLALLATAVHLYRHRDEPPSIEDNPLLRLARRRLRLGAAAMALVAVAVADLVFALDSIPAIFGISQETFIVFAANAMALLGLRPLYFLVTGLLDRLVHLSAGLALVLAFIGVKLLLHYGHTLHHGIPEIGTGASLAVIVAILAVTTVTSLITVRRREAEAAV